MSDFEDQPQQSSKPSRGRSMPPQLFRRGDVVRLKSGGPDMIVEHYVSDGPGGTDQVYCTWFVGPSVEGGWNGPSSCSFHASCLEKVD